MKYAIPCLSVLVVTPALAIVFGGSNLGFGGYPDHTCSEPYVPYEFADEFARRRLLDEIDRYRRCVEEYVENGDNDKRRIGEAQDTAIEEFNSFIDSL